MIRSAAAAALAAAAGLALVVGLLTPATHGTFSAAVGSTGSVALTPFLTCAAAAADEQRRGDLVFAYPLSEPSETSEADDVSASERTAEYSGARATTKPTAGGCLRDRGRAWAPDGETSGLTTPAVELEHAFSFEIRFRTTQPSAVIASITPQGTDQTYALAAVDGGVALLAPDGRPVLQDASTVADGAWHHLALVVEEQAIRLYVDSREVASQPFRLTGRFGATWRLAIGGPDGQRLPLFRGALVWAELINRPLSAAEVHAHDLSGRTPPLPGRFSPPRTRIAQSAPETPANAAPAEAAPAPDLPGAEAPGTPTSSRRSRPTRGPRRTRAQGKR